jgi:cell division protein FtsB
MQDIRHHKESFFHTRFWIVILLLICGVLTLSVVRMVKKYVHAKSIRDDYAVELKQNQQHQAELQKNIVALSTDRGKEAEIRDRYRVVKQGEQMILIVDNDKSIKSETGDIQRKSFFSRVWDGIAAIFQ